MKRPCGKSKPTCRVLTNTVIPAKAGIQWPQSLITVLILSSYPLWTPAFAGVTGWFSNCQQALVEIQMILTDIDYRVQTK